MAPGESFNRRRMYQWLPTLTIAECKSLGIPEHLLQAFNEHYSERYGGVIHCLLLALEEERHNRKGLLCGQVTAYIPSLSLITID